LLLLLQAAAILADRFQPVGLDLLKPQPRQVIR
jgi:hypothetical protein